MDDDPYAALAGLYDFAYWDFSEDADFYLNLARLHDRAPVLELGVGTGRVALRLAAAGMKVTGIDQSPSMLARARENLAGAGAAARRVSLVQAPMTSFDLGQRFGTVIIAGNTFQHLLTAADQRACLASAAAHLQPGGIFAMSIHSPAAVAWDNGGAPQELRLHWVRRDPRTGEQVMKMMAADPDPERMVRRVTYVYDRISDDGSVRRTLFETDLRYSTQGEVELLLQEAGLRVTHVYGDYDLTPVGPDTEQLIFVARAGSPLEDRT
jgi:SAM-dependent methyltransferase